MYLSFEKIRYCGGKMVEEIACPNCGARLKAGDLGWYSEALDGTANTVVLKAYCPHCGAVVVERYDHPVRLIDNSTQKEKIRGVSPV